MQIHKVEMINRLAYCKQQRGCWWAKRSGEINWLVEIIGNQKNRGGLYEKLNKDVFKDQTFKVRTQNDKGERLVREVGKSDSSSSAL